MSISLRMRCLALAALALFATSCRLDLSDGLEIADPSAIETVSEGSTEPENEPPDDVAQLDSSELVIDGPVEAPLDFSGDNSIEIDDLLQGVPVTTEGDETSDAQGGDTGDSDAADDGSDDGADDSDGDTEGDDSDDDNDAEPTPTATSNSSNAGATSGGGVSTVSVSGGTYALDTPPDTGLNVRESPNSTTIVGVLNPGDTVNATGAGRRLGSTTWAEVTPIGEADWDRGWVALSFIDQQVATPTATPDPDATATPEPTPTPDPDATATPVPTATAVPTATPVPTATAVPTATPVPAATATPVPTLTPAPTVDSFPADFERQFMVNPDIADSRGMRLFAEARSGSAVLGFIPPGAVVVVVGRDGFRVDGVPLVRISYAGQIGWVDVNQLRS